MKLKVAISLFLLSFAYLSLSTAIYADGDCQSIYGGQIYGGQNCSQIESVIINKTVQNPENGVFVNNLGLNDPKFNQDQTVNFKLTVTNDGPIVIGKTTVKDIFPQYLSFVAGPGSFDSNTNTLTFTLDNLAVNETRTFNVSGKISYGTNPNISCVVNQSSATTDNSQVSQSNSQFCIQPVVTTKGGLIVQNIPVMKKTPSTGPEELPLLFLIPTGAFGAILRKRSSLQ